MASDFVHGRIPTTLRHIQKTWKAAGCWELLPAMTNPRHGCAACCTNGIVYVLGGADDAQSNAYCSCLGSACHLRIAVFVPDINRYQMAGTPHLYSLLCIVFFFSQNLG